MGAMGAVACGLGMGATGQQAISEACAAEPTAEGSVVLTPEGFFDPVRFVTGLADHELDAMLRDEPQITEDYVAPNGRVIPAIWLRVRNRINRLGAGLGSIIAGNGDEWDYFIEYCFRGNEDDAAVYMQMPIGEWFNANDLSVLCGRSEEECLEICNRLAETSIIFSTSRADVRYFTLMGRAVGFWEAQMDMYSVDFFEKSNLACGKDPAIEGALSVTPLVYFIPPSKDVVKGEMAPYSDWEAIIDRNEWITVSPCQCHLMSGPDVLNVATEECNANHPLDTCLSFGEYAQHYIERGVGKRITKEEAKEIVRRDIELGLGIETMYTKTHEVMCTGCHVDHCGPMGGIRATNGGLDYMGSVSFYTLEYDPASCSQCGVCIERCPMHSITVGEDGYMATDSACVRCGQCAYKCPNDARWLVATDRSQLAQLGDDLMDYFQRSSRIRMAQGLIQDFVPSAQ